jgi:hypothetical protein
VGDSNGWHADLTWHGVAWRDGTVIWHRGRGVRRYNKGKAIQCNMARQRSRDGEQMARCWGWGFGGRWNGAMHNASTLDGKMGGVMVELRCALLPE